MTVAEPNAPSHNLPAQLTTFVGRERELAELARLLGPTRLLTLTGAGGVGKTRLAFEVAERLTGRFQDGVWAVELASLADPALVAPTLVDALGLRQEHGRPPLATLVDHLRSGRALLVLDNCEHLVEAVARLVEALLRACPGLRVLATSREPLAVPGEVAWSVPPLAAPYPERLPPLDELPRYASVRLFVERAAGARPGFDLTRANARAVAELCYRLDGLPLAIELAAARVRMMPVEEVADRIGSRFALLTGGTRTAPRRHQTLRGAIDWSYGLLTAEEQRLLDRLSVFAGGWTLEAAEAVCGRDCDAPVLDTLGRLVDKSLVVAEEHLGQARYRLLETLRQYAAERLSARGEESEIARRHARFVRGLAERADVALHSADQVAWLERLRREADNIRAALRWAIEAGDAETAATTVGELLWFWEFTGRQSECRAWQEAILAMPVWAGVAGGAPPSLRLARARLLRLAFMAWVHGDLEVAQSQSEEGLALARELGDARLEAWALTLVGIVCRSRGAYDNTWRHCDEAVEMYRAAGDRRGEALALFLTGTAAFFRGDYRLARERLEAGLALGREVGDRWAIASCLGDLGDVAYREGRHAEARRLSEQSIAVARELGIPRLVSLRLLNLGRLALASGDADGARASFRSALRTLREPRDGFRIAAVLEGLAGAAALGRQPERAFRLAGAAEALREAMGARAPAAECDDLERWLAPARAALDEAAQAAAGAAGRSMQLDAAAEEALADDEPFPAPRLAGAPARTRDAPPTPRGASPLTERETNVARLVAEGLTNRQIAERLVISPRTADRHVENILARLGLSSRTQIAAWVWRMGSHAHDAAAGDG